MNSKVTKKGHLLISLLLNKKILVALDHNFEFHSNIYSTQSVIEKNELWYS